MGQPQVEYESGAQVYAFEEMTDSGDNTSFAASFFPLSQDDGVDFLIAPYGVLTGGAITPTSTINQALIAAFTARAPGMAGADADGLVSIAAGNLTASRGTGGDTHRITSFTVSAAGSLVAVPGSASTAFTEDRGVAGGPPYIPVGSIELGQARVTSTSDGVLLTTEIFDSPGVHVERADNPVINTTDYANGTVQFAAALPQIHTGDLPKKVYIKGGTPIFSPLADAYDWVPSDETYTLNTTQTYDRAVGSETVSRTAATFTFIPSSTIDNDFISRKGRKLWIRYREDRDKTYPRQLTVGRVSFARTNPASGSKVVTATIVSEGETVDQASAA